MTRTEGFSPESLERILAPLTAQRLWVACSGGVDSMTLFHAIATHRDLFPLPVGAIHVNHHWHADAGKMESLVRRCAGEWSTPFIALSIDQPARCPGGWEACARKLRYQALAAELAAGDVLLTAHHANDQLETMLLALLRGSGLQGLRGMVHEPKMLGKGRLVRPLLGFSHAELVRYALDAGVSWIEDPTNQDCRSARNYLRHKVMARLEERWPKAAHSADGAARLLEESFSFLRRRLGQEMQLACNPRWSGLRVEALRKLPEDELPLVIRYWIQTDGEAAWIPSRHQMNALIRVVWNAPGTRHVSFAVGDGLIALHDGHLFVVKPLPPVDSAPLAIRWDPDCRLWQLRSGWGSLRLARGYPGNVFGLDPGSWRITLRAGGEKMAWHPGSGHTELKEIFRSESVPPWLRSRIPLVFAGSELLAAGEWFWNPNGMAGDQKPDQSPFSWMPDEANLLHEKERYDHFFRNPGAGQDRAAANREAGSVPEGWHPES